MSDRARRRRALLLIALALTSGGLAASQVRAERRDVESQVGRPATVVVAREDLTAGTELEPELLEQRLEVREVPERYVPPDSLVSPEEAMGLRTAVPIAAGSYVTLGSLETESVRDQAGPALAPGERIVELAVAGGETLAASGPGSRVDVLITTEGGSGAGRTYVALENVEVLDVRSGGGDYEAEPGTAAARARASLRVTLQQAVLLTSAQNFAREVRLLARAPEDRKRVGPASVESGDL